jgi:hypothetical protein
MNPGIGFFLNLKPKDKIRKKHRELPRRNILLSHLLLLPEKLINRLKVVNIL